MHPIETILQWGCAMMIALYASNLVAGAERVAIYAARFGWPD